MTTMWQNDWRRLSVICSNRKKTVIDLDRSSMDFFTENLKNTSEDADLRFREHPSSESALILCLGGRVVATSDGRFNHKASQATPVSAPKTHTLTNTVSALDKSKSSRAGPKHILLEFLAFVGVSLECSRY